MHGLVQAAPCAVGQLAADRGRREHADRAGQDRSLVAENVSEEVLGHHHVEGCGAQQQLHRAIVDEHVLEFDVGILRGQLVHDAPPELRVLEHVGLVHRGELAAPVARQLEGHAANALDLPSRVDHRVQGSLGARGSFDAARLAEVQAAGEFPHDQDVGAAHDVVLQRRGLDQALVAVDRPQVGVHVQRLAQAEQAFLGPLGRRQVIEFGQAHRAQQRGVGIQSQAARLGRERVSRGANRRTAEQALAQLDRMAPLRRHVLKHANGLARDLGTDTVARKDEHSPMHGKSHCTV